MRLGAVQRQCCGPAAQTTAGLTGAAAAAARVQILATGLLNTSTGASQPYWRFAPAVQLPVQPAIDLAGALLIAAALSAAVLMYLHQRRRCWRASR
jgi:hypothetical protein